MNRVTPVMMGAITATLAVVAQTFLTLVPPPAYGLCVVCHGRDLVVWLAGTLTGISLPGAATASAWPLLTVVGIFLGSRYAALSNAEYSARWVDPPLTAFACGMGVMILGLMIMGCPARLLLRSAYGDLIAAAAMLAVLVGVVIATTVMRRRAR